MPRLPPLDGTEVRSALAPSPNGGGRSQLTNCGQPATGIDGGGDGTDIEQKFVSASRKL